MYRVIRPYGWTFASAEVLHIAVTIVIALHLLVTLHGSAVGEAWKLLWILGIALLAGAPRLPVLGLWSYVVLAYMVPRYGPEQALLYYSGALNWCCLLMVSGWAIWCGRHGTWPRVDHPVFRVVLAFFLWLAVSAVVVIVGDGLYPVFPRHDPIQYVHGLILFVVASQALTERTDGRGLALGLGALLLVRGAIQGGSGLYLDGDIGPLLVMTLPLVWWAGIELRGIASRMLIAAMVIAMLTLVVATENRGAAVALGVVVLAVMWQLMRRFRYVLLVAPLVLAAALALVPASYTHRFAAIWDQTLSHPTAGLDRATVAERLDLWSAGIKMTLAHPVFGVGPGNYPNLINSLVVSGNENLVAHNSLVNVAAESGLPGLVLFVTLFAAIGLLLVGVIRQQHVGWRVSAAWSLLTSLLAYLAAGLFISRQDMPLAYLLLGWGFAIAVVGPGQGGCGPIASPRGARA